MTDTAAMTWTVLVNSEEQCGLHPADLPVPQGWQSVGFTGSEEQCIRHVDATWTDMRPLSLRTALDASAS
ncbi:MbtH family protein [Salinispora arenicola]|uniref:MbtH family protein n=1 Tax=Salinispora arenicola TaxID=168697 RepID=UPI00036CC864|nr:MbtH family NRPS accessory protein [Salinispora arenicola]